MHPEILQATFWVAACWSVTLAALVGIGSFFLNAFSLRLDTAERVLQSTLAGYCLTLAILQIWHLFFPINVGLLGGLLVLAAIGLWQQRHDLRRYLPSSLRATLPIALAAPLILWLANLSTGPVGIGDTLGYHLPSTRWMRLYPIVPGLANLDGRLGYNSSSLIFSTLFEVGPLAGKSHHLTTGPLILIFSGMVLLGLRRWLAPGLSAQERASSAALIALLTPLGLITISRHMVSLSTDIPILVLSSATAWLFCAYLFHPPSPTSIPLTRTEAAFTPALLGLLSGAAIACKLPIAPFAGGTMVIVMALAIYRGRSLRTILLPTLLATLLVLPWGLRGILLSGYPAFPMTVLGASVDWAVPRELAEAEAAYSISSGRDDRLVSFGSQWFEAWIEGSGRDTLIVTPALLSLLIFAWLILLAAHRRSWSPIKPLLVAVPGLFACLVWLTMNPMTRFGFGILWITCALSVSAGIDATPRYWQSRSARTLLAVACFGLAGWVLATSDGAGTIEARSGQPIFTEPHEGRGLQPAPPGVSAPYRTHSGLEVAAIRNPGRNLPLLSTTRPVANLTLRGSEPSGGFRVGSEWQPLWFPNIRSDFRYLWTSYLEHGTPATPTNRDFRKRRQKTLRQVEWIDPDGWPLRRAGLGRDSDPLDP